MLRSGQDSFILQHQRSRNQEFSCFPGERHQAKLWKHPPGLRTAATRTDVSSTTRTDTSYHKQYRLQYRYFAAPALASQILVERNLEVEQFVAVRIAHLCRCSFAPAADPATPKYRKTGIPRMWCADPQSPPEYSKSSKSCSIFWSLALGFSLMDGHRPGQRNLLALPFLLAHQPFHVLRLGSLDPVARRRLKQNPRIPQADRPVAVVGHNQPHRHHAVAQVIHAKIASFSFVS